MVGGELSVWNTATIRPPDVVRRRIWHRLAGAWTRRFQPRRRRLRLAETLDLGERRLVAVVEFEGQRFLIAATSSSVALLAALPPAEAGSEAACKAI